MERCKKNRIYLSTSVRRFPCYITANRNKREVKRIALKAAEEIKKRNSMVESRDLYVKRD
jgi:hypothetical protein